MTKPKKPTNVMIILDGWGVAPKSEGNAIELAKKPFFDSLVKKYPYAELNATGLAVGLSENERSGSEAGHINIGAGRIIKQDSQIINEDIESGKFFKNPRIKRTLNHAMVQKKDLHIVGLLSDSDSPHSDPGHLYALLKMAKDAGLKDVYLHLFTDGRDTYEKRALHFLGELRDKIDEIGIGKIATIGGRYYAMDRVKHWDRLQRAYDVMVLGEGAKSDSPEQAIKDSYNHGLTDEFIIPTVIVNKRGKPIAKIKDGDAVIFFNLRGDRARQMTKLITVSEMRDYKNRTHKLSGIFMCTLADFGQDLPVQIAYVSQAVDDTLPKVLKDYKQLYIAEAEKYPHVTYFINGGHREPVDGEDREKIVSKNVFSYDQRPEMSAEDVTDVIVSNIEHSVYDFILVNYANADMVGHTGNLKATICAVEFLDKCMERVISKVLESGGLAIITADHGNADEMIDPETGYVSTMHSKNPVPFIIAKKGFNKENCRLKENGVLGNVAPTLLDLLKIPKPKAMVIGSLIKK
ncbi:MAG: 2,3-bisphosphoglycerate-independent phosphoglycerate mutase [Candidatus Pacebacteria bacterium]|nr:2,3-bisphosphoglycerate-independent phosphoglycerate mutase [Candidatus Paceibacterota bacterium]